MVISRRRTAANGNVAELYSLAVDSKHPLARFKRNYVVTGFHRIVLVRAGGQSEGRKCEKQEFFHLSFDFKYVRKIKNPVPEPPGIEPFSRPYPYFSHEIPRLAMLRSPQTHPEKRFFLVGKLQGRSSGSSLPQRLPGPLGPVAFSVSRQLSELTAAGTAADFHGIPI